jgi:glutaconyl-CoA decarboxylase
VILVEEPVTTNPFIIMLINMTVVFAVLIGLSIMIRLIHYIDPTRKREEKEIAVPAVASSPVPAEAAADGIPGEDIAAIMAALAMYGYGGAQIHAIRPTVSSRWRNAGRIERLNA